MAAMDILDLQALTELALTRTEQQQQQHQYEDDRKPERRLSIGTSSTVSTSSTCTSSSSSIISSTTRCRRVKFDSFEYSRTYVIPPSFETDDEKADLWYNKTDIGAATKMEKDSIPLHIAATPSYMLHLVQIWRTPCMDTQVLDKLVSPIHDSPMRGLEKHCLKAMKQRRGIVLRKVLQAQQEFAWIASAEERALLLRDECEPLSRTSARFAKAMAQGDAMAAASSHTASY
jgi:hypothetical protein